MTSIHFRQFQGAGSFQLKKPHQLSPSDSQIITVSQNFLYCCKHFFFNKELFKSTYPFKLQFILYHHLSKFKTKIKLLTFCPKFHPYFQSLFFNRISNLKSIWIPYRQLLRQNNDIVSESVSFVSSHCISKL